MLTLVALLLAQTPQHALFRQPNLPSSSFAFFEFAPASGAGMPAPCSTTAPTGAKGETLAFTRASSATCTKGVNGLRTTGIADGDLVVLSSGQPRVELDADGVAALLVESAATTIDLQTRAVCNAAWSDVGTPSCSADSVTGPWGTQTMALLTDNDGAAKEGRSQTVASTSATRATAYCYVKAGTATSATISIAGTGNTTGDCSATKSGLSTTTSDIITCTSASAYTGSVTALTLSILVGADVADTGTLYVEGCYLRVSSPGYRVSQVDTTGATVARNAEVPSFAISGTSQTICMAAYFSPLWPYNAGPTSSLLSQNGANASTLWQLSGGGRFLSGGVTGVATLANATAPWRVFGYSNGTNTVSNWAGATGSAAAGAAASRWGTTLGICEGTPAGAGGSCDGLISRVAVDPNPAHARCTP